MSVTFDELAVGQSHVEDVVFTPERTAQFLALTGDANELHTAPSSASERGSEGLVVYGFLLSVQFSYILGMRLPGGKIVIGRVEMDFHDPVYVGETVSYRVTVRRVVRSLGFVALDLEAHKQDGTLCVRGKAICSLRRPTAA